MNPSSFPLRAWPCAALLLVLASGSLLRGSDAGAAVPPAAAVQRLLDGNKRFASGAMTHPAQDPERRRQLAKAQQPFAVVLTCADSRLSPEIIFDQGLGDLFVVRNAGNLSDDHVLGSIEYAVEHLHASVIVVLGHSHCGAVTAAVSGGEAPGHIRSIVEALRPAVSMAKKKDGDAVSHAIRINAKLTAAALTHADPILEKAVAAGQVRVLAGLYQLESGQVEILP